jgi:hypothetical protein
MQNAPLTFAKDAFRLRPRAIAGPMLLELEAHAHSGLVFLGIRT